MTEREKMLAGMLYDPSDTEIAELRKKAHALSTRYNTLTEDDPERGKIVSELVPNMGKRGFVQGPVQFDYGVFTEIGDNFYANFNLTVLVQPCDGC